jgi:hypothetical protein
MGYNPQNFSDLFTTQQVLTHRKTLNFNFFFTTLNQCTKFLTLYNLVIHQTYSKIHKDTQSTYSVKLRRFLATIFSVEKR